MESSSQSRHFNLQWLDRPQAWLAAFEHVSPTDAKEAWAWQVTHHQLLTLAKRSEREAGLSILWFSVSTPTDDPDRKVEPVLAGAVLPGDRIAVVPQAAGAKGLSLSTEDRDALSRFLKARLKISTVMGAEAALQTLGFLNDEDIVERQTSWSKRLTIASPKASAATSSHSQNADGDSPAPDLTLTSRRASETDRSTLNRWSRTFATDTRANASATTLEAAEWMRRGRLLIFESTVPVGMTALSGEYNDRTFGRSCRLSLVFTDPVYRGRGVGREMMRVIEEEVRLENANALVLYSDPTNGRTTSFYSGLGFKTSDDWVEVSVAGFNVNTTG